ncbi:MAG: DNA gyrase inhibitor YacG [Hydrogenophaga sp.]|uniref:DNA gyrase inhibitor YacG n=1 Tax=Hydrogenophaga sp. TaxID=1904254 RepID=UPI002752B0A7|nr:DNA gyrase inhibitor YacG [Hydrogenophaga sp.]MDP2417079.1 DNA gyrase inhibitor YacG [Hydrogenophaga sp.]MDZ4189668.1 DNA gyrase inhibitor YacG [Hydrogenophaga sp.]
MPNNASEVQVKVVRCPACAGPSIYAASNPYRPFCCQRCKNLDFGAWASESFKLPESLTDSDTAFKDS